MQPILTVTERGSQRYVVGDATPAPSTALAKIDVDATVRSAIDAQSSIVREYMRGVGSTATRTIDAGAQRAPQGYSNAEELRHRNRRYFVTIGAYVAVAAAVCYGLVWLATLADLTPGDWFWPAWLTTSGAMALGLIWATHRSEADRTPEGIELERVRSDGYATERAADGQFLISQAISQAIGFRAESEFADATARLAATDAAYASMRPAPDARRFAVRWQEEDAGMMTLATEIPLAPSPAPPRPAAAPRYTVTAMQPDAACLAMCAAVSAIFAGCAATGDDLVTGRLPWGARGDWGAPMKKKAIAVLAAMDPPLLLSGDGNRYRLNRAQWCEALAVGAIRRRWMTVL